MKKSLSAAECLVAESCHGLRQAVALALVTVISNRAERCCAVERLTAYNRQIGGQNDAFELLAIPEHIGRTRFSVGVAEMFHALGYGYADKSALIERVRTHRYKTLRQFYALECGARLKHFLAQCLDALAEFYVRKLGAAREDTLAEYCVRRVELNGLKRA